MTEETSRKSVARRFSRDFLYSVFGLGIMNVVIQFVVYPLLQRWIGAAAFGIAQSLISVISIMCVSFATGANYSHVVGSAEHDDIRGDYNIFMAIICVLSIVVAIVAGIIIAGLDPVIIVGFCALMVFSLLRYYSDVEFKLTLDFKGYFLYYLTMSIAYLAGVGVLYLGLGFLDIVQCWWVAILFGEVAAVIFVKVRGHIYDKPLFRRSPNFRRNALSILALSGAYLLSGIIMNADRLLLLAFVGATEVTIFYISTLLGKTVALLTAPLDGVIIGYLTKHDMTVTRSFVWKFSLAAIAAGVVLSAITVGLSYPFIWFLYPNLFAQAQPFFIVASVGQVFYFLGEMMLVVVLRVAPERYQLYINIGYTIAFFAAAVPAVITGGIWGIAIAILVVNLSRFLFVVFFGVRYAARNEREAALKSE